MGKRVPNKEVKVSKYTKRTAKHNDSVLTVSYYALVVGGHPLHQTVEAIEVLQYISPELYATLDYQIKTNCEANAVDPSNYTSVEDIGKDEFMVKYKEALRYLSKVTFE